MESSGPALVMTPAALTAGHHASAANAASTATPALIQISLIGWTLRTWQLNQARASLATFSCHAGATPTAAHPAWRPPSRPSGMGARKVVLAREQRDRLAPHEVAHRNHTTLDLRQRPVALVGDAPHRAAHRRRA